MKPITVSEPNDRFIRLKITAQEREEAEADILLQAGFFYYAGMWLIAAAIVAAIVEGFIWADRMQVAFTGSH